MSLKGIPLVNIFSFFVWSSEYIDLILNVSRVLQTWTQSFNHFIPSTYMVKLLKKICIKGHEYDCSSMMFDAWTFFGYDTSVNAIVLIFSSVLILGMTLYHIGTSCTFLRQINIIINICNWIQFISWYFVNYMFSYISIF